ncbi:hypothetical protein I6I57_07615 [Brevibacterium casei]|uniref:radical SAM protein n=1 Tax=Brevibacterium casei TaxID=33889 RepID=UPI001917D223|nr:radical SAM protein [Brevibacterium casei]QQT70711.1 hypothetical protein I6I57_07615 [Brevibacterium casei]
MKKRARKCPHCGKPAHQHMTVQRLTQFAILTAEEVEEQNRRAYGNFPPGSAARMNRAEAWMRGEPTCEACGKPRGKNKRFCSRRCQFPGPDQPMTPDEILEEGRAAHRKAVQVAQGAGEVT